MTYLVGIDTSIYQGEMNMQTAYDANVRVHVGRLTVGDYYIDPNGAPNYHKANAANIPTAFYLVIAPAATNASDARRIDAQQHVDHFLARMTEIGPPTLKDKATGKPIVVLDCELHRNTGASWTTSVIQNSVLLLEQAGYVVWIYTAAWFWNANVLPWSGWAERALWVANYTTAAEPLLPYSWSSWAAWQYSAGGNGMGATYGASSSDIDLNRVKPEFVTGEPVTDQPPNFTEGWPGRGVHIEELYEVFPALKNPYHEPGEWNPDNYVAQIAAFVDKCLDAVITHVYIDVCWGDYLYNQRRLDAINYVDDALPPLIAALHDADIAAVGVQRIQTNTTVYGEAFEQALAVSRRIQEFGMDGLLTWLPDDLTSAKWTNRLNTYSSFIVNGEERFGVAPLMVARGFCAPPLPSQVPDYPWKQVFLGPPALTDPATGWVVAYKYLNAAYQVPRIPAADAPAVIDKCVGEYVKNLWVDDPGDPNCKNPAAIWPVLMTTGATAEQAEAFENKAATVGQSRAFSNLAEFPAAVLEYVYDEEPTEPPVEPPPPATNPPDEVLFRVKIAGLPSGVTLRLRSTPTTAPTDGENVVGMTWNDERFDVMAVAQDQNGKDWYCIGPLTPESIWVASWYTVKI